LLAKALERTWECRCSGTADADGDRRAGFTRTADELRRAMGSKRSADRMERLKERLYDGMAANGIVGELRTTCS
jgi:hypothetical protein